MSTTLLYLWFSFNKSDICSLFSKYNWTFSTILYERQINLSNVIKIYNVSLNVSLLVLYFSFQFSVYVSTVWVSVQLCGCVCVGVYQIFDRGFSPFSSNWPASLSSRLLDNWTCNPSFRLPIIASLQPPLHPIYLSSQCESLCGPIFDQ